jgi:hypothetical protein
VDQRLRDLGSVRLAGRQIQPELDGAVEAVAVRGAEGQRGAGFHVAQDAASVGRRVVAAEREHEAHRGAAVDGVGQHVGEVAEAGLGRLAGEERHRAAGRVIAQASASSDPNATPA